MPENTFVDISDLKIHCQVTKTSAGKPWLVFGNSLLTDLSIWDEQAGAFSATHNILCYDQRGHGKSSIPNDMPVMDELSQDLLDLLDKFGINSCIYIGVSMGVPTGLGAYKKQPQRFKGLVLSDGLAKPSPAGIAAWSERLTKVRDTSISAYVDDTMTRWFSPSFFSQTKKRANAFRQMMKQTTLAGFAVGVNALQNFDHAEMLSAINVPVLTIAGQNDGAMPAVMKKMADGITGARFVSIADAGHLPNVENPEGFNVSLRCFIKTYE